jgi:hypothetical protein
MAKTYCVLSQDAELLALETTVVLTIFNISTPEKNARIAPSLPIE